MPGHQLGHHSQPQNVSTDILGTLGCKAIPSSIRLARHQVAAMPRPRLRRELCDCRDCVDGLAVQPVAEQKHAAALLDPPPKCVVLYGDSFLALPTDCRNDDDNTQDTEPRRAAQGQPADSLDAAHCPHLDRLAQDGCSGFVAMRASAGARALTSSWLQPSPPRLLLPCSSTESTSRLRHAGLPPSGVEALQQLFGGEGGAPQKPASIADRWLGVCSHVTCHRWCNMPDKGVLVPSSSC